MRTLSLCLLLAATACLGAAPPVKRAIRDDRPGLHVHGETVLVVTKLPFEVHCGGPAADLYFWTIPPGWKATGEDGDTLTVSIAPEGAATVKLVTLTFSLVDGKLQRKRDTHSLTVNVGKVTPPAPPVPPVPPGPVPPDPPPVPPGPTGPLKVLMLYESGETIPPGLDAVLRGAKVRDYLRARCAKDPDPATDGKAYRIWDRDVDPKYSAKFWQDAVGRFRKSGAKHPWLMIWRDAADPVFEGTLPGDPATALAILQKFGGS